MKHSEKAKMWMFVLWAGMALLVLFDAGVLSATPNGGIALSGGVWLQQIIESAKMKSTLYLMVGILALSFFYKQNEIMAWLEIHAPF